MAGDWIKMRPSLLTSPKVNGIARLLESSRDVSRSLSTGYSGNMSDVVTRNVMRHVTVSSLLIVWGAANEHTDNGVFRNADLSDLDDMVGIPGFGEAMAAVGWAEYDHDSNTVTLPNFNEYNTSGASRSAGAKTAAQRQKEYRGRQKQLDRYVTSDVTHNVTSDVTSNRREEKIREEVNNPPKAPPENSGEQSAIAAGAAQASSAGSSRNRPEGKTTFETWYRVCQQQGIKPLTDFDALWTYAETVGLSRDLILLAWVRFKDHYSTDEKGKRKRYIDWRAVFLRSVKDCWHRLWFIRDGGGFELTTIGQQAMRELEAAA